MRWHEIVEAYKKQSVSQDDLDSLDYDGRLDPERLDYLKNAHAKEPWRGPHEGRELQLLLSGKKPAAMVPDHELQGFQEYIDNGTLLCAETPWGGCFVLSKDQDRINQVVRLLQHAKEHRDDDDFNEAKFEARFGLLLGYNKDQIHKFINM
jgi:hypothetical protein